MKRKRVVTEKTVTRWCIVGSYGLYVGQSLSRRCAIGDHCRTLGQTWDYCRRKGDRAIKVLITYEVPDAR